MENNKSQLPKISIIIPCYNDGAYIHEALQSLEHQTYQDFEIIIIDDASDDKTTKEVLSTLEQDNLKVIYLDDNSGPAIARNKGIAIAQGKYILPLDADDKIAPSYVEKAKNILDQNNDIGIVYCEASFFGEQNGKWELKPYRFPDILVSNMIFATAMYRKEEWKRVGGYNENMRQGNEDYDFWISLLELQKQVFQIPETLFYYRIKANSRTIQLKQNEDNEINSYIQIFNNHKKLYMEHIDIFFKALKQRQNAMQEKDFEIKSVHHRLKEAFERTAELNEMLNYAHSIVELRDKQIEYLRLKNRIKRFIPQKVLSFFGYTYVPNPDESSLKKLSYCYSLPTLTDNIKAKLTTLTYKPLISIIMPVYNVDVQWLKLAIQSIENQWYDKWELCIADDNSTKKETIEYLQSLKHSQIKITYLKENLNISGASNAAISLATGEYIALMDNDDEITPDALYEIVKVINEKDAEFIYSDEDFISTEGEHSNPHYKPDFSPDLLLSHNYITHFTCFKKALLDKSGLYNSEFDGAQDYDLFLRLTEHTTKIYHIPKVLYHWRMLETSTSINSDVKPEALTRGKTLLEKTLQRRQINATVLNGNMHHYYRVNYDIIGSPLVSIIIPFKDKPELLDVCINSILEKSTYGNYEIIGISNNSEEVSTFKMMATLENKDSRISFYEYNTEFNYADINNYAVDTYAKGEHILLLNNDIEVIEPSWIEAMLEHSQRDTIGCVGAKLYYPNDTIQHAGIIIGLGGYAGHSHKMSPRENPGYFNRLNTIQNVSAVTAACLMVKKHIYQEINGMDELQFKVAYNDVDFCLRVREQGYLNIFTPYAQMYHHESISRGYETTPEKIDRFQKEKDALSQRHKDILENGDPYYNPNLTHDKEDFTLCLK